jgi:fructose-1-phosphate kinase PfkB-like protein
MAALGGHTGDAIIEAARLEGIELVSTRTESKTRHYTVVWDPTRKILTQLAERWSDVSAREWASFIDTVAKQVTNRTSFGAAAISGRMPPGVAVEEVTALVQLITSQGIPCYVDAAGATLEPLLAAKPNGVKINNIEAGEYLRAPINSVQEAATACQQVISQGIESCIITMGVHGAVGATESAAYHVTIADPGPWPVGSGDSFFGALVVKQAQGESWLNALIAGAAAGTANAHRQIAGLFDIEQFERGLAEARCVRLS